MKSLFFFILVVLVCFSVVLAAPSATPQKPATATANKGAFNPAFDEIVVESSLTVRGKNAGPRQGRKLVVIPANENITVKTSLSSQSTSSPSTSTSSNETSSQR